MDSELNEVLMTLVQKIDSIDKTMNQHFKEVDNRLDTIDERTKKTDLQLENKIVPTLQLVLENQSSVTATKEQVAELSAKLDEVASDVDVIKEVVTQHSGEIAALKKHA
ncbi:MAG: hypothetical protein ACOX6U_10455 [Oscillospiraceae bacterium]|jgi:tetrahydromethanopterin S-methyltransferase subunit G